MRTRIVAVLLAGVSTLLLGADRRPSWTTSRISGSPEPPPPFKVERLAPNLSFQHGTHIAVAPDSGRLFVTEQRGKIFSFALDSVAAKADPVIDFAKDVASCKPNERIKEFGALYAMTFHPRFQENRLAYVCYMLETKDRGRLRALERVSRFRIPAGDPPRLDAASEQVILEWVTEPGGHNGGSLNFGPDGFLYISMGDAADPSPPDMYNTGQNLDDFWSTILRIDVEREENGRKYAVPADNPFVKTPGAKPEIWAIGFRNPWKMSFDRATGDLWVGDVGWERSEMVYRVRRGGNYGWSIMEGRLPVRPSATPGPGPILPPALEFPHSEAASITGGFVYRGKRLPDLAGSYVCGDWMTGTFWATRFDDADQILSHREIARSRLKIIGFAEDRDGELLLLDYGEPGGVYRLVPNPAVKAYRSGFPRKLSESGLFASVKDHTPAPGVLPYRINAEPWADHATMERLVGLPGDSTIRVYDRPVPVPGAAFYRASIFFPKDGVLAKTFSLEMEAGNTKSRRRIETQILHHDGEDWRGYTYRWNENQTDAELVPASGDEVTLDIRDPQSPGGKRKQHWRFPGRGECVQCHNGWAGSVLSFMPAQLDDGAGQLEKLRDIGALTPVLADGKPKQATANLKPKLKLVDPHGISHGLESRARSYLHVNCAHCHQSGGGGNAVIDVRFDLPLKQTQAWDARPMQGTFDIPEARILAPGDPCRSILYFRMAKLGPGRMPHIGSTHVDRRGLALIHDWLAQGKTGEDPLLAKIASDADRGAAIEALLSSIPGSLRLMRAFDMGTIPPAARASVLKAAMTRDGPVRDLFEPFVPDEQRVTRLGVNVRPETLLTAKGDAVRGRDVYLKTAGLNCAACHKFAGQGGAVGPELEGVGKRLTKAQIVESLLDPSKTIDPKFTSYLLETKAGKVHTGIIVTRTESEIVLRDAQNREIRVPANQIATFEPQKKSLMPEQQLGGLTLRQAADLIAFLESLK